MKSPRELALIGSCVSSGWRAKQNGRAMLLKRDFGPLRELPLVPSLFFAPLHTRLHPNHDKLLSKCPAVAVSVSVIVFERGVPFVVPLPGQNHHVARTRCGSGGSGWLRPAPHASPFGERRGAGAKHQHGAGQRHTLMDTQ